MCLTLKCIPISRPEEMQGYDLHGHMDLHTWHTHMGSTGTAAQYILTVPLSGDDHLLGTRTLNQLVRQVR